MGGEGVNFFLSKTVISIFLKRSLNCAEDFIIYNEK